MSDSKPVDVTLNKPSKDEQANSRPSTPASGDELTHYEVPSTPSVDESALLTILEQSSTVPQSDQDTDLSKRLQKTFLHAPVVTIADDSASDADFLDAHDLESEDCQESDIAVPLDAAADVTVSHLPGEDTKEISSMEEHGREGLVENDGDEIPELDTTADKSSNVDENDRENGADNITGNATEMGIVNDDDDDFGDDDFGDFGEAAPTQAADDDDFGDFGEADGSSNDPPRSVPKHDLPIPAFTEENLASKEAFRAALRPCMDLLFPLSDKDRYDNPIMMDPVPELVSDRAKELWKRLSAPLPRSTLKWEETYIRKQYLAAFGVADPLDPTLKPIPDEAVNPRLSISSKRTTSPARKSADVAPTNPPTTTGKLLQPASRTGSPSPARKSDNKAPEVDINEITALTAITHETLINFSDQNLVQHVSGLGIALAQITAAVEYWELQSKKGQEELDALEQLIGNLIRQIQILKR